MRLEESDRLVTIVLVLNSRCGKIHDISLTTIAVHLFLGTARHWSVFNRDGHLWFTADSTRYVSVRELLHTVNVYC